MKSYEVLYILSAELADEVRETLIDKFCAVVTDNGGSVEKLDKWGVRKFAYPINYKTEGFYVLMNFSAEPTIPAELSRQLRITDGVVRNMILSLDDVYGAKEVKEVKEEAEVEEVKAKKPAKTPKADADVEAEAKTEEAAKAAPDVKA